MPRTKAKKSPLASTQPKQTRSKSKQDLSATIIGTISASPNRLSPVKSPASDSELDKYLDCSNTEPSPSNSDSDSDLASCYDDLETRLPVEGKVNPVLDHSVLVALLKAQNKENIAVMQSMVEKTLKESTQSFKSEVVKQMTDMKSELIGLIDQQGKDFASFKKKCDERLTNIHSISKDNVSITNRKIEAVEKKIDSLESTMSKDKEKVPNLISTMNAAVVEQCLGHKEEMLGKIVKLEEQNREQQSSIEFICKENDDLKKEVNDLKSKIATSQTQFQTFEIAQGRQQTEINDVKQQTQSSDLRQRKLNLIFEGLPEVKNEYAKDTIYKILEDSDLFDDVPEIDAAYRLGKQSSDSSRPILVSFKNQTDKDLVLHNAARIKKETENEMLWINRDHPDLTRRQTAHTRRCYNLMKSNNHSCQVHGTSITYKNKVYQYKDLNDLPEGSRLEDTKLVECDEGKGICFQSELAYLSNMYPCEFIYRNKPFLSSEQAYQWEKALNAGKVSKARKILFMTDAFSAKREGDLITPSDQWDNLKEDILLKIVLQKFQQNPILEKRLVDSQYTKFYECTKDSYWGVKQLITSREIDPSTFTGANRFGVILAEVKIRLSDKLHKSSA